MPSWIRGRPRRRFTSPADGPRHDRATAEWAVHVRFARHTACLDKVVKSTATGWACPSSAGSPATTDTTASSSPFPARTPTSSSRREAPTRARLRIPRRFSCSISAPRMPSRRPSAAPAQIPCRRQTPTGPQTVSRSRIPTAGVWSSYRRPGSHETLHLTCERGARTAGPNAVTRSPACPRSARRGP